MREVAASLGMSDVPYYVRSTSGTRGRLAGREPRVVIRSIAHVDQCILHALCVLCVLLRSEDVHRIELQLFASRRSITILRGRWSGDDGTLLRGDRRAQ